MIQEAAQGRLAADHSRARSKNCSRGKLSRMMQTGELLATLNLKMCGAFSANSAPPRDKSKTACGAVTINGGIATFEELHRFFEHGAVWQAFEGGNVFEHCDIQRHVQGPQMRRRLHLNGPVGGREPEHFIFAVGQLCGHQFGLALGFGHVGKAEFLALAAIVIDQGELRIDLIGNTICAGINFHGDVAALDFHGFVAD